MTVVWAARGLLLFGLVCGLAALVAMFVRRRGQAASQQDREAVLRAARAATRQIARDTRRTGRGTLRGKGGGGNDGLAADAASGSDGGTPSGV
ncbi:hypothetical protein AB0283_26025 [Micromonospora vinacea]|uniref:hypothetical protein n=1 Tax=Micromonospora vinacea TaxID=709878 RepID=UPI00344F230A